MFGDPSPGQEVGKKWWDGDERPSGGVILLHGIYQVLMESNYVNGWEPGVTQCTKS